MNAPLTLVENVDFEFVEKDDVEFYSVRILNGEYTGVIYKYGPVRLVEEADNLRVTFKYNIEFVPDGLDEWRDLESSHRFNHFMGELLRNLLESNRGKIGGLVTPT
jgi:hypothetical protein